MHLRHTKMAVDDLTTLKTISIKSKKKVLPRYILSDNESEVFCIRFSPDDTYLAGLLLIKLNYASASFSSGIVKVYNTSTGKVAYNLFHSDSPVTQLVIFEFLLILIQDSLETSH